MDPDATGVNSEVRYEVTDSSTFDINPVTGVYAICMYVCMQ